MSTGFSRTSSIRVLAVLLLGVVIAGCLDRVVTGPEQGVASLAAKLVLVTGNSQTGPVNRALTTPVKLKVTDANGGIVKGGTVSFGVRKGGGTITPASGVSGDDGTVSATWTLGTALGAQQVVATLTGDFVVDSATLNATATNGPASKITIDVGDGQRAVIGTQLPVAAGAVVTDDYGYAVAGADVTFRVVTGGGRIELVRTSTDSTGRMSARWSLGTVAGQQTISASLATGASITFKATADAGLPSTVIQESGSGQTGTVGRTLASPVSIRVVDGYGNNVRGVSVTWTAEDGSIAATSASTDTLGRSLARWTLGSRTGTQNAAASVAGATPVSVVAVAQPGTPNTVTKETGDAQTQTVRQTLPLPLVARVTDQYGNPVPSVAVTWAAASGGGSMLSTSASTDNSGRASAVWTLGPPAGSQIATMAITGLPLTVYNATAIAAAGDSLLIEAGNNQTGTVGAALGTPLLVRVRDTSGNPVVGTSVVFAVASGGGSVTPLLAVTDASGRAQAVWSLGSFAGPQTVTATVGSKSVTFTATGVAVGGGGGGGGGGTLTPTQIVLVSGNGQTGSVGQSLNNPIVVQVIDASGIPVTGVNVTWTLAAGNSGGLASPSVSRTDGSGNANLLWTLGSKVGLQQVTASVTGVTSVTLQATALIGSSGALLIDNGDGQGGATGAALATYLRVLVLDQSGTPVVGARVVWSTAAANGTLSKASGLTNASGLDSASWTLGAALATQNATATVTGLPAVTFRATGSTSGGVPTTLRVVSGDGQVGRSATVLGAPLVVEVRDASGTPLSGVSVLFTQGATNTDGYVSPSPTTTNASGQVSVQWTLGSNATNAVKTNSVSVTLPSFAAVTSVSFTATARPQYRMRYVRGTSSAAHCIAALGVACPTGLQVDTTGATLKPQSAGDARTDTLVVQVYDPTDSTGVQGISVTWAGQAGDVIDGRAVNAAVTTDNFGFAKNVWLLRSNTGIAIPPNGVAKRMIARSDGVGEVEFQARVFPGRMVTVSVAAPATKLNTDSSNVVTIKATDVSGYAISGASVTFAVSAGSASPAAVSTGADGTASVAWRFGAVAGAQTLTVTILTSATGPYPGVPLMTFIVPYGVNP